MIARTLVREAYRRERIPDRVRWWLAAQGMRDWYRVLARGLIPHLPDARSILSALAFETFSRRSDRRGRSLAIFMSALYRMHTAPRAAWIFQAGGGPARGMELFSGARMIRSMSARARWEEVTVHLGELLIVLTERLPDRLPHARKILGDICFEMGAKFGAHAKKSLGLADGAEPAIEVLRMSEYVFRVNPDHWHAADGHTGFLEGTACPWFDRPGWNGGHCGIFGQFQSGISSVFGLRYHLAKTIPKHGGTTCRVDLKPLQIRLPSR